MRGVFRSELEFLATFTNLHATRFSVRTKIPGGVFQFGFAAFFPPEPKFRANRQFKCEAFFGQNRNSWQTLPV